MRRAVWTTEQQKKLERLAALGIAASLIAAAVNKTKNAVIGRAQRQKVKLRESPARGTPDAYPCRHERTQTNTKVSRYLSGPQKGTVKRRCYICYGRWRRAYDSQRSKPCVPAQPTK